MRKTVTLDSKRRATFPKPCQPGDVFLLQDEGDGIVLRKVEARQARTLKPRRIGGRLMVPDLAATDAEIAAAVRADRDR